MCLKNFGKAGKLAQHQSQQTMVTISIRLFVRASMFKCWGVLLNYLLSYHSIVFLKINKVHKKCANLLCTTGVARVEISGIKAVPLSDCQFIRNPRPVLLKSEWNSTRSWLELVRTGCGIVTPQNFPSSGESALFPSLSCQKKQKPNIPVYLHSSA